MSEPFVTQIAVAFTRWRYKSRGTPGYNGTPVYRVLHHIQNCNLMLVQRRKWWSNIKPATGDIGLCFLIAETLWRNLSSYILEKYFVHSQEDQPREFGE